MGVSGCGVNVLTADGVALTGPCESPWFAHVPRQASDMHTTIIESSRTKITRQSIRLVLYTLSFLNPTHRHSDVKTADLDLIMPNLCAKINDNSAQFMYKM